MGITAYGYAMSATTIHDLTGPQATATRRPARTQPPSTPRSSSAARRQVAREVALRVGAVVALVAIWWAVSAWGKPDPTLRPSPLLVWHTFLDLANPAGAGYNGLTLWGHLATSLRRIGIGASAGVGAGLVLGLLMGTIRPIGIVLAPLLNFVRALPPLAYFSLVVVWFGIDEKPKLMLLAIAALPPVAIVTADAVSSAPKALVEAARSLGAGRLGTIRDVVIPSALPQVLVGVRLSVAIAYSSVVAAETVNGLPGIGGMVRDAQNYNNTAVVLVGIFAIGFSGLLIDGAIALATRRTSRWRSLT